MKVKNNTYICKRKISNMTAQNLKVGKTYIIQAVGRTPLCKNPKKITISENTTTCIVWKSESGVETIQTKEYLDKYYQILEEL